MTTHISDRGSRGRAQQYPLDVARDSFAALTAGPSPTVVDGRDFPGLPNRDIPLDELRDRLLSRHCSPTTRDAVWRYLVGRSRNEGAAWTLACAGMALPALAGVAQWLWARFPGEVYDVHAEVLTGFLKALATVDLNRPRVLVRLRWSAYREGLAALTEALVAPAPARQEFRSVPPRPPWGHPDLVLDKAVGAGVLTRTEADLIGDTRLDEVAITDWADQNHVTGGAAYKARRRAELRLAAYLRAEARDTDGDDPVVTQALDSLLADAGRSPVSSPDVTVFGVGAGEEVAVGLSKTGPDSGLLGCGGSAPASTLEPDSEVRRCA